MIRKNEDAIVRLFEFVGEIDMAVSVASFRESLDVYCIPTFEGDDRLAGTDNWNMGSGKYPGSNKDLGGSKVPNKNVLKIQGVFHPLISNPVQNTVLLNCNSFLTGANASGK